MSDKELNSVIDRAEDEYQKLKDKVIEQSLEIEKLNNIINTILEFDLFKSNCPLDFSYTEKCDEDEAQNVFYEDAYCEENCSNEFKKCWLKYFEELQELKGEVKNGYN